MTITENMDEGERERFEEQIGMRPDPEKEARAALRRHQEETGMRFDNPDAPVAASPNYVPPQDEEIPGSWMGAGP